MFIAELFTIAKIRKPSKCAATDDWIRKLWYPYTMKCDRAIKSSDTLNNKCCQGYGEKRTSFTGLHCHPLHPQVHFKPTSPSLGIRNVTYRILACFFPPSMGMLSGFPDVSHIWPSTSALKGPLNMAKCPLDCKTD